MSARLVLGLAVGVAVVAGARAQQAGSVRGSTIDKDFDAPLAGASVQIVETGQRVESNDQGAFVFPQVAPGRYTIVAAKEGYVRAVRADVVVAAAQMTELRLELAGDFTDMEEFVVRDALQVDTGSEQALLDIRFESASMMDSISSDTMSRAGVSDAVGALKLVTGASSADGKSAVIRGLPDRYVSSQMNGVLLPTADEDKRAVELDQFPSEVIESVQVAKTFTPDQQGNASGGAVNVVLKGVPDEPLFVKWKTGTSWNSQVDGRGDFLSYEGGGVHAFGKGGGERSVQELGENWTGAIGASEREAPIEYKGSLSGGGSFDIGRGWRAGGLVNLFYERDNSFFANGIDDSLWALQVGEPLTPQYTQGAPQQGQFYTSLLDVTQSKQTAQWGGLATFGIASDDHAVTFVYLRTRAAEDTVTLAEDTRGKQYFYPGHDPEVPTSPGFEAPEGAPYLRLQTLSYAERSTETLQLTGRHRLRVHGVGPLEAAELQWTIARSQAERDEPDKRQFASAWDPNGVYRQYKPAASFTLGNLQRTFEKIQEDSEEEALSVKLPFQVWDRKAYLEVGGFRDSVDRAFDQDSYSNFLDQSFFVGRFDELDWSRNWAFEDHPITASERDVDYRGEQNLIAGYAMLELPVTAWAKLIGGARIESTAIDIVNTAEVDAEWVPPGEFGTAALEAGVGDVAFRQQDVLPSIALVLDPIERVTLRVAYNETVARQTFKELTPIFQSEYVGGPVFIGNPDLRMSAVRNYDLRLDWLPIDGSLLSASWFRKDIVDPIEYVEKNADFSFTTAVNYPRGTMSGLELEARQQLGELWQPLQGFAVGANSTWIEATVRRPLDEILQFEQLQGVRPRAIRDMTNAPEYLYNLFATWDVEATKTAFGLFYTVTGDTLVQGTGPSNDYFIPATYETRYETLNASISQALGPHVRLTLAGKNLTNALRREVYRSEFIADDVTRRSFTDGVEWSLSIGGEIRF